MQLSKVRNQPLERPSARATAKGTRSQAGSFAGLLRQQLGAQSRDLPASSVVSQIRAATSQAPVAAPIRPSPFNMTTPAPPAVAQPPAAAAGSSVAVTARTEPEGSNGPVDPTLAATIRSVAASYGLPPVTILSVQNAYAGFSNPQTRSDHFITGLVQFPDGRTITAAEFFDSPINDVAARMQQYAGLYRT